MNIDLNIRKLRELKGLSQQDLADKLKVSSNTIYNYEKGNKTPNLKRLIQMAEVFDCTLDELIQMDIALESYHEELEAIANKYNSNKNNGK